MRDEGIGQDWKLSVEAAREDQIRLRSKLRLQNLMLDTVPFALAVGVAYSPQKKLAIAVAAPMTLDGALLEQDAVFAAYEPSEFPYVPGLFAYREGPAICRLLDSLPGLPRLIVFDAQGIAHPRGFGLASHIGVLYDVPTLGMTRKRLFGRAPKLPEQDGASAWIRDKSGSAIGVVCRYRARCEPVYCSPGHLTSIQTVRRYCEQVKSVRSCFPLALAVVHEQANKLVKNPTI